MTSKGRGIHVSTEMTFEDQTYYSKEKKKRKVP
jgi:hypothetical protein